MSVSHFADRLVAAVRRVKNPVLVGLDPRAESLPPGLIRGEGLEATARGYVAFCRGVIDVVAPLVAAVKPQAAFFEQLGPAGCVALAEVMKYAASKGLSSSSTASGTTSAARPRAMPRRIWGRATRVRGAPTP